jgi:hypothetical protein
LTAAAAAMAAVAALVATAHVAGRLLTGRVGFRDPLERGVVATAVGLAALAHLALALAFAGALRAAPVAAAFLILHGAGWRIWRQSWRPVRGAAARLRRLARERPLLVLLAAVALAAAALPLLLLPLYPPTAFDATLYHLPYLRAFARSGTAPFLPDLRLPIFPQLNELLMSPAYLFAGDLGAQLTMAAATLASAALTFLWGRSAFPESRAAAAGAAAAFLGNPIIVVLAGTAYVEPGLVLWVTASLYALHRFRQGGGRSWTALAALFAGCAAGGKYLGLFFVPLGLLVVLAGGLPRRTPSRRVLDGLLFALVAAMVLAPWYGRIVAATGNPLFPFFPGVFGGSVWQPMVANQGLGGGAALSGAAAGVAAAAGSGGTARAALAEAGHWLWALLRLPWDLVIGWQRAGLTVPPSPWYLLSAPLMLLAAWRERRIRWPLLLAAVYAAALVPLPADVRYLTPVLPAVSLALGGALAYALGDLAGAKPARAATEGGGGHAVQAAAAPGGDSARACAPAQAGAPAQSGAPGGSEPGGLPARSEGPADRPWVVIVMVALLLLPGWAYGLNRVARQGALPLDRAQREAYLARSLPLYPALQALNRSRDSGYTLYAFFAENMTYFADGRFLGDWTGPASFLRLPPLAGDPEALRRALRRLGADHLLVPNSPEMTRITAAPAFRRCFQPVYRDGAARVFALAPAGAPAASPPEAPPGAP